MIEVIHTLPALIFGFGMGFCFACYLARRGEIAGVVPEDKIDGLEADLDSAVKVAYDRGAKEWTRLNYPQLFERFEGRV